MKKLIACMAAVLMLSGCSSVQFAEKFNSMPGNDAGQVPMAHINVKITGLYFLGFIPLITGSPVGAGRCTGFSDTVNADNAIYMLTRNSRAIGGTKVVDMVTSRSDFPLLFLLSLKSIEASGTAFGRR